MARTWCLLNPNGKALVGIPVHNKESIIFNAARIYGKTLLAQLFANFKLIHTSVDYEKTVGDCIWCYQPLYLLEKIDS